MNLSIPTPSRLVQLLLFALVGSFALIYLHAPGTGDMLTYQGWLDSVNTIGLKTFYIADPDYPPGTVSIFWAADHVFPGGSFIAIKLLLMTGLFLTSVVIGLIVKNINAATIALAVLTPGATGLGYTDIMFALPLILALWALSKRWYWAFSILFATASLIKWQPLLLLPFVIVYVLGDGETGTKIWAKVRALLLLILPGLAIGLITCIVFTFEAVGTSFARISGLPFFSGNAFNFEWLLIWANSGFHGTVRYAYISEVPPWMSIVGPVIMAVLLLFIIVMFALSNRSRNNFYLTMIVSFMVYSAFNTNVHENYWFVASFLALLGLWWMPRLRLQFIAIIAISLINLIGIYGITGTQSVGSKLIGPVDATVLTALLFVGTTLYLVVVHAREMRREDWFVGDRHLVRRVLFGSPVSEPAEEAVVTSTPQTV